MYCGRIDGPIDCQFANPCLQRSVTNMQFGPLTLKHCKYGWMLYSGPTIGKCFEVYGQYSESEVAMMRGFLRPGDTVIDVGANIGDLTVPLSRMVGDSGAFTRWNPAQAYSMCYARTLH